MEMECTLEHKRELRELDARLPYASEASTTASQQTDQCNMGKDSSYLDGSA